MSFGFGVGDFIAVIELAWKITRAVKEVPKAFHHIQQEFESFRAVIYEANERISKQQLSLRQDKHLKDVLHGCKCVLSDLERHVERYQSRSGPRKWFQRVELAGTNVAPLRARLTFHALLLSGYIS